MKRIARTLRVLVPIAGLAAVALPAALAATTICKPDLVIDKTGPATVNYGDTVTYGITVRHAPGSSPLAVPVQSVTDKLGASAGVGLVLMSGDTNKNAKLDPGEIWSYGTAAGPFTTKASSCDDIVNTVTLAAYGQGNAANDTDTVRTKVVCKPDLVIQKSAPAWVNFGDTVTYGIAVKHAPGSDPIAASVQSVTDTLGASAGVGLVLMSGDVNQNAKLDPGETWQYGTADGPFTTKASSCDDIVNTASLASYGDTNPANDTDTVTTHVTCTPDLVIEKTADAQSVDFGGSVAYAITVKHAPGSDPVAVPVQSVTDTLGTGPAVDLVLMSGDTNQNAKLDPDETWSYGTAEGPFTAHADACGPLVNTATLYAEGDVNPANDSSTATVAVKCALDVAILKGADKATYAPGDTITYTVTVTNTGQLPVPFSAIHVSDPTLPALSPVAPTPDVLAPGASHAYTGTRTVGKADCGQVKNTAMVALTGDPQPESSTANNTASVTVTVDGALCNVIVGEPQTTLRITKVGPRTSQPRRAVPYRIRVTNSGSVLAKSVVLTDPIPSGMVLAKLPKGATLVKGKVRWSIGDLAPGQKVSFTVLLRSDVNANRTRCNIATAGAANARPVRGKACTTFVQIAGAGRLPVVTG